MAPVAMMSADSAPAGTLSFPPLSLEGYGPARATPPATWCPGAIGARYRVEGNIGAGGSALVLLAYDQRLGRRVALKMLRPELSGTTGRERFVREIRITAALVHPNIVPVLEADDVGEALYYTMPFISGETLRERLHRERQLPLVTAIRVARGIAAALRQVHSLGIVHRDLKPGNVLLVGDEPLLADFGAAREVDQEPERGLTRAADGGIGTPQYMSPEQAALGERVDARSDLYGLGCVLYEMLAGLPPFQGATPLAVLERMTKDAPPDPRRLRPSVPAPLGGLVTRLLARNPADRCQSAAEVEEVLRRVEDALQLREDGSRIWFVEMPRAESADREPKPEI